MLLALSLRDFVIVEQLDLNFQSGFTVLTGETGAGKSVTLDALGLLLGSKADFSQVRSGAKEARLSAVFDVSSLSDVQNMLYQQGLADEGAEELSLRRIIDAKGKSRSFINGQAATLAQLKQIGSRLIDIHGQHAHHSLNQESEQRRLLDAFSGSPEAAADTRAAYQAWRAAEEALREARDLGGQLETERERLQWQLDELDELNPKNGEWEGLEQSHERLAHAAELLEAAAEVEEYVAGDEGMQSLLSRCRRAIGKLADIEPRFGESLDLLESIDAELDEVARNVRQVANRTELNPAELAAQEARMADLMSAARKYRVEPDELPQKRADIETALASLAAAADLEALSAAAKQARAAYMEAAEHLSKLRRAAAAKLSAETAKQMQQLAMKGARFEVALLPAEPSANGLEQVQFQVSANQGTPLRPLNKVASGGELARISLAVQVVTSRYTRVPTLIFDEVDSGIGGGVAETVGRALRRLGQDYQVLAVTHLPQVAACGEQHWRVAKMSGGGQTVSEIAVLEDKERIGEIARMLGGEKITATTLAHAEEMLAMAAKAA